MWSDDQIGYELRANKKQALLKEASISGLSEDAISVLLTKQIRTIADLVKVANNNSLWQRLSRADIAIFDKFLRQFALHRWMTEQDVDALLT